jgi:hypothetical protein
MSVSSIGSVWVRQDNGGQSTSVAITFPSTGLIVQYSRPAAGSQAAAASYQSQASAFPNSMSVTDVDGVPALATKEDSDEIGTNFGAVDFVAGDTEIGVLGHYDLATLRTLAASVLAAAD